MDQSRQTWRVQGVPLEFDITKLIDVLENHQTLRAVNTPGRSDSNVSVHTLAPTLRSDKIATIRFQSIPQQLAELGRNDQLTIDILAAESPHAGGKRKRDPISTIRLVIDRHFEGVSVLFAPAEEHNVDILAISGLGSHPYGSFTNKRDGHMWLSDSLPRDMPTARVMIYGYESGLRHSTSFSSLDDLASPLRVTICQLLQSKGKPLILIGHSLGGLLVKEALIRIFESGSDSRLIGHIVGILFFGVPNNGMDIESLIPIVHGQPNMPLIESISNVESDILNMQERDFSKVLKNIKLQMFCFYETKLSPTAAKDQSGNYTMSGPLRRLVSRASATSCLLSEMSLDHLIAVDRTHSELVKFSLHDAVYNTVSYILGQIQRFRSQKILHSISDTADKTARGDWVIPFGRNRDFVGRESILDQLLDLIPPSKEMENCQQIAIEGLGGIGKTQIALEAVFRVREEYPGCNIFWVPAVDLATFENAYRQIGLKLKVPGIDEDKVDVKVLVKTALCQSADEWLLVIDNADDVELLFGNGLLYDHLPFSYKGSIMFTTRNHDVVRKLDIPRTHVFRISEMNRSEAMELMQKSLEPEQTSDYISTTELLDILANLPLAVKQASAFMNKTKITTTRYLEHCRSSDRKFIKLLSKDFEDRGRYRNTGSIANPVATTWLISFRHLSRDSPPAARCLEYLSFLSEKMIPKSLLLGDDELEIDETIGALESYAFITQRADQDSYDIHRLIQIAMRNWLRQEGELEERVTTLIQQLHDKFPSPKHENRVTWIKYMPHAVTALKFCNSSSNKIAKASLLFNVAESHFILGKYQIAEEMHRQALALRRQVLGDEHLDILNSMNNLGLVLENQGKYDEAEAMHRQELALTRQVLGDEHPGTLISMNNLGVVLESQGKYDEAEAMHRQELALTRQVLGDEHPDTLISMDNLGLVLKSQGKYDEAEAMHRQSLALWRQVLGDEHPDTLISMNNLGLVLKSQGKYDEAEAMHRQSLALRRQVLGDKHPDTLNSMNNLGLVLESQGKYDEAEAMHRQSLALRRQVLGDEHPGTLVSMNNLGSVLKSQGKYDEAEAMHRQSLALRRQVLGDEHPDTLNSMNDLGLVLKSQGKYDEAEAMHRQELALTRQVLGDEHPDTLISMNNLGIVLESQGKYDEAEAMHRQGLALRRQVLGDKHPDTLSSMNNLGVVLESQGKYDEAEAMHRQGLALMRQVLGDEHPDTLISMNNLGLVLNGQGKYDEAEAMHRQVLALRRQVLGDEHPDTLISMDNLGHVLKGQGKYDEAEAMHRQVLALRRQVLGDEHPDTLISMNNLGAVLQSQGKYDEAEAMQ